MTKTKMPQHFMTGMLLLAALTGCSSPAVLAKPKQEVSAESYRNVQGKGLVVLSVIWARTWKCSQFENAQLRSIGFDRIPLQTTADDVVSELLIEGSPFYADQRPVNYVLAVAPGEFALTNFAIKVASSATDPKVGNVGRAKLFDREKPLGGTFNVKADELIYVGHFGLDCHKEPVVWRYYVEGRDGFENYKALIKRQYGFIDVDRMQFRLFKTSLFGQDYALPE